MRVLYLCESNCGLARIRNDNFPKKKILRFFFFFFLGGGVTWFLGGSEGISHRQKRIEGGIEKNDCQLGGAGGESFEYYRVLREIR